MTVKKPMLKPWLVILTVNLLSACSTTSAQRPPKVSTSYVTYIGQYSTINNQVAEFLGIPFATPPINELRWHAPQAYRHKSDTYRADDYKPACYQDSYNVEWYKGVAKLFGHQLDMKMPKVSEDCLYLNIWVPLSIQEKRPVMVWIHGGSNKSGWSYEPNYLGHYLAAEGDVIVVSIAYRLGVFGFMAHPDLSIANFGLLDQIQSLKWIQDNIEYFGGDKNNITIFGESAGAANVGYLMSSPMAKNLFHKAISQSGGFQLIADTDLKEGRKFGTQIVKENQVKNLNELRQLPSEKIWQSSKNADQNYDYRALADDYFISGSSIEALANNASVDLLIGNNKNEYYFYQNNNIELLSVSNSFVPEQLIPSLLAKAETFDDKKDAQDWLDTFVYMSCPSLKMAQITSANNNVWLYRFDRIRTGADQLKAYHGAEIPYIFNSHDSWLPTNQYDLNLSKFMLNAWANFARTGNPNDDFENNPIWRKLSNSHQELLSLDNNIEMKKNEQWALCQQMWQE